MKRIATFGLLLVWMAVSSCTSNERARKWGGSSTIDLLPGQKLVNVTWKEANLWILTRAAKPGERPETLVFTEDASWGVLNGKITFQEK
jgi:hypothetical protein